MRPIKLTHVSFAIALAAIIASNANALTPEQTAGLDLGTDKNYAIIALGNNNTPDFGWNSGPVGGNVLIGLGENAKFSGGGNGGLSNGGVLYYDSTVTGQNTFNSLQNPPPTSQVSTSVTTDAKQIAQNVSAYAASLTPTMTFDDMPGTTTITGNGDLNVISVNNMHNVTLTLSGSPSDYFVFNVAGLLDTNRPMTLSGDINVEHILFNFLGTGTVLTDFQTSGGNTLYGTYLATDGGKFQFSNLALTGRLINVGGNVQFVSGSHMTVPEPSTGALALFALAISATTIAVRRRAH